MSADHINVNYEDIETIQSTCTTLDSLLSTTLDLKIKTKLHRLLYHVFDLLHDFNKTFHKKYNSSYKLINKKWNVFFTTQLLMRHKGIDLNEIFSFSHEEEQVFKFNSEHYFLCFVKSFRTICDINVYDTPFFCKKINCIWNMGLIIFNILIFQMVVLFDISWKGLLFYAMFLWSIFMVEIFYNTPNLPSISLFLIRLLFLYDFVQYFHGYGTYTVVVMALLRFTLYSCCK